MILLLSSALAAAPDPDAIRALAERDPQAATLASVGLDIEGLEFLCEGEAALPDKPDDPWRWAVFTSERTPEELAVEIRADIGYPSRAADRPLTWDGDGDSVWFAGNDLAYDHPRIHLLAVGDPPAHLTCPNGATTPSGARSLMGITAQRNRRIAGQKRSYAEPLVASEPPPEGCLELKLAASAWGHDVLPTSGSRVLVTGPGPHYIDLNGGERELLEPPHLGPLVGRLPDGRWMFWRRRGLFVSPTAEWEPSPVPYPTAWTQGWSPLATATGVTLAEGPVVTNGFDPPLMWRDERWVEPPKGAARLLGRETLLLEDGRLLTWADGAAEIVDLERDSVTSIGPATWASAIQLGDGRILTARSEGGGTTIEALRLSTTEPEVSWTVCGGGPPLLVRLSSGRVVLVLPLRGGFIDLYELDLP